MKRPFDESRTATGRNPARGRGKLKKEEIKMCYYLSWSPRTGESTYTRCFATAADRDHYAAMIDAKSVYMWETTCNH